MPLYFLISGMFFKTYGGFDKRVPILAILSLACGPLGFFLGVNRVFVWANFDNALTATPFFFVGY